MEEVNINGFEFNTEDVQHFETGAWRRAYSNVQLNS